MPQRFLISFLIAFGFPIERDARWIFVKTSLFVAHLCAVTLPTPPAPMMSTVLISQIYSLERYIQALPRESQTQALLCAGGARRHRSRRRVFLRRLF